jgi:predicted GIY-YIG superfamily endonuclease
VPWVYILRCGDNSLYVGHTGNLDARLRWHRAGAGAGHTAARLPVDLVYREELPSTIEAVSRERQLKRWSAEKKSALIAGDLSRLRQLSRRRRPER